MTSVASAPCWPFRGVSARGTRRAVAAQIRHDHPEAGLRQHRDDIDEGVDVVGPAVQQDDDGTIGGPGFGVTDIEDAGIDLFQRGKRSVGTRLDRARARLCARRTAQRGCRSWRTARPPASRRRCQGSGGGQGWSARTWISLRLCYLIRLDRMTIYDQHEASQSRVEAGMKSAEGKNLPTQTRPVQACCVLKQTREISASISPAPRMAHTPRRHRARRRFRRCGRAGRRRRGWRVRAARGSRRRARAR